MRKTEVFNQFSVEHQQVIRYMLRLSPDERKEAPEDYRALLRKYWRLHRRRSRDQLPGLDDHRHNKAYHAWLRGQRLPVKYDRKSYEQFRKEVQCKS